MAIKVPDNFRPSDYGIRLSIPKPDIECRKNEDGSFSMYAGYSCDSISDFAREAAREMKYKMESELIDELLRMNGYVPERTCKNVYDEMEIGACDNGFECSECGEKVEDCEGYHVNGTWNYCPGCGAKVVE